MVGSLPFQQHSFPSPRANRVGGAPSARCIWAATALLLLAAAPAGAQSDDGEAPLRRAPQGTPFVFEVIESLDASYLGDTPSHVGRDGGLDVRPNVALGDAVYRQPEEGGDAPPIRVGTVTRVVWERVSRSLTVEFDPAPLVRIAVGDEVWVDLNPAPLP